MSIETRLNAINDHLIDDYSVLTLAGADLTNVDKNIINLKPTWKERLLYFMNNGTDVAWDNWEKVVGEGTSLTLSNTEQAPMKVLLSPSTTTQNTITGEVGTEVVNTSINVSDLNTSKESYITLKGNTYQFTTTGKNKLQYTLDSIKSINAGGTWNNNAYTWNGITFTINDDLSIKVNGTASAASYLILNNSLSLTNGTEYILSGCPSGGNVSTYALRLYTGSSYESEVGAGKTFTYSSQDLVRVNVFNGITVNNLTFYPMIRLSGVSDSTYEPYTNGASPNPTYPQDIEVVTGDNKVEVCGKNLININGNIVKRETASYSNIIRTENTLSYNITTAIAGYIGYVIPIEIGQQYTISYEITKGTMQMVELDNAITEVGTNYGYGFPNGYTFTATKPYVGIWLIANTDGGSMASVSNLMLERGSTATTYEAYQGNTYEVNLGKNLLPTNSFTLVKGSSRTIQINFPTPIPAGTYTLSCKITNKSGLTSSNGMAWALYDSSTTPATSRASFTQIIDSTTSPYSSTKTTTGKSTHLYIYLQNVLEDTATITIEDLQLEKGNKATTYAPYFTPIELCKIGNYQDRIFKSGDKWYLHKEIGKDNVNIGSTTTYQSKTAGIMSLASKISNANSGCYCYKAKWVDRSQVNANTNECYDNANNVVFVGTAEDTLETLQTKFNGAPIYYILKEITNTEITDSALLTQLNALYNATTYSTTNINTITNDLLPYIDFKYNVVTPSPSPDRPSEVKVVSGDNYITSTGKNLLGIKEWLEYFNISYTENNGAITFNTASVLYNTTYPIKEIDRGILSYKITNGTGTNFRVRFVYEDGTMNENSGSGTGTSEVTISNTSSVGRGKLVGLRMNWTNAGTFTIKEAMLEQYVEGQTSTYEPFGEIYNVNLGKNLVPFTNQSFVLNNISYYVQNGSLYLNGTSTGETSSQNQNFKDNFSFTLEPGNYMLRKSLSSGRVYVRKYDDNETILNLASTTNYASFSLTEKTKVYIGFYILNNTFNNENSKIMIENGSIVTDYAPYFTPIELCKIGNYQDKLFRNSGKNLFNIQDISTTNTTNWTLTKSINAITIQHNNNYSTGAPNLQLGVLKSGSYTISYNSTNSKKLSLYVNGSYNKGLNNNETLIANGNDSYAIYFQVGDNESQTFSDIILSKGTTALPYEPYGTGEWYKKAEINKVVFNGNVNENWTKYTTTDSQNITYGFYSSLPLIPLQETVTSNFALSNNFIQKWRSTVSTEANQGMFMGSGNTFYIKIAQDLVSGGTVENFKTWLSTHNTEIYYVLATPTYTKITGTLETQLEEVYRAKSYENETNVSQQNYDLPFVLSVSALSQEV